MRLDVTSAKMRKRLVAELSAHTPSPHKEHAPHDAAPLVPEAAQPRAQHEPQRLVKWAQAALSVLLGLRLPLDGVLGATTQTALRRFQSQNGLSQNGALDAPTVLALAKAIGHPAPGMPAEHKLMPQWFRLDRQGPRSKAPTPVARKSQGPDDAWTTVTPPEVQKKPVEPDLAPHKKPRPEDEL